MKRFVALMLVCASVAVIAGCDCGSIKNWGPGPMHLSPVTKDAAK
jgi:hypothetical protein